MTRLPKSALAFIALASVIAGGCGGTSATPSPTPITDPNVVITRSLAAIPAVTSLHVKLEVSGKANIGTLTGGRIGFGLLGNVDVSGTTVEGDVDVAKLATDLKFAVPGLLGLTGEIVVIDGNVYEKNSLTDPKFKVSKLSDSVPIAMPSPGALASIDVVAGLAPFRKILTDAGATPTLLADDKVNGQDAYHVSVSVPIDAINTLLAGQGSSTAAMKLDSASLDYWAYTDTLLPARITIVASGASLGNLTLVFTLTDYGKSVSVTAPAASDIQS